LIRDPRGEPERLPALRRDGDDELSPELALVDPDAAERARAALPDITLPEIRVSPSLKAEQTDQPAPPGHKLVAVAVAHPPAPSPALARSPASPAPPAYDEIGRVFDEPRVRRRRGRRSMLAAALILCVAGGVALALPRGLDRQGSQTSASRLGLQSSAAAQAPSHAHRAKPQTYRAKRTRKRAAKPRAHRKAAARRSRAARPVHNPQSAAKRHASAPRAAPKPVSKHLPTTVHRSQRAIPDFVWVPAKNVSGYLIEFRSGSKLVLRARARAARLHVSRKRLPRGRYRWFVWALNQAGSPTGKPLVDSNVRVR
jgi:hypothetical protein